jgi:hypothetical protein
MSDIDLLGGAQRVRTRVRGFTPWNPKEDTLRLLAQVAEVLREYADYLPLTLRQIFYRLVGAHDYEKTEPAYKRLGEHLNRARRAKMIPMSSIRDDGGTTIDQHCYRDASRFLYFVRLAAEGMELDHSAGQTRHNFAEQLVDQDRPTEVLDIGDHDASGVHKYLAFQEDIQAFAREFGGDVTFTRLAVTPAQIREYRLPTAPPNPEDKRAFSGKTRQVEALVPDDLAAIVRSAIESRIDQAVLDRVLRREKRERAKLIKVLGR